MEKRRLELEKMSLTLTIPTGPAHTLQRGDREQRGGAEACACLARGDHSRRNRRRQVLTGGGEDEVEASDSRQISPIHCTGSLRTSRR